MMTWDILPGQEQDYFEFVVRDFIPGVQKLGLQPSQAWFTLYGESPQILAEMLTPDLGSAQKVLDSQDWEDLKLRLFEYVEDFSLKIIDARRGFQI
jgi:hypothetical protein